MLIGGREIDISDDDAVKQALDALPTGFRERTAQSPYHANVGSIYEIYCEVVAIRDAWKQERNDKKLKDAINKLEDAADTLREDGNMMGYAALMDESMAMRYEIRHYHEFLEKSKTAQVVSEENNYGRFLSRILSSQHAALVESYTIAQDSGTLPDATSLKEEMHVVRLRAIDRMLRGAGEQKNDDAIRVEQGEIGLSADKPIGTDNIWECVCVAIRDPVTKKTALAHIDIGNDAESLQIALDRLPS